MSHIVIRSARWTFNRKNSVFKVFERDTDKPFKFVRTQRTYTKPREASLFEFEKRGNERLVIARAENLYRFNYAYAYGPSTGKDCTIVYVADAPLTGGE